MRNSLISESVSVFVSMGLLCSWYLNVCGRLRSISVFTIFFLLRRMTFYLFKVYTLFSLPPPEVSFRHPHNGHINPLASNPGACYWAMAYDKHCISTLKTVPKDSLTHLTGLLRHHPVFEDHPRHLTFFSGQAPALQQMEHHIV